MKSPQGTRSHRIQCYEVIPDVSKNYLPPLMGTPHLALDWNDLSMPHPPKDAPGQDLVCL